MNRLSVKMFYRLLSRFYPLIAIAVLLAPAPLASPEGAPQSNESGGPSSAAHLCAQTAGA